LPGGCATRTRARAAPRSLLRSRHRRVLRRLPATAPLRLGRLPPRRRHQRRLRPVELRGPLCAPDPVRARSRLQPRPRPSGRLRSRWLRSPRWSPRRRSHPSPSRKARRRQRRLPPGRRPVRPVRSSRRSRRDPRLPAPSPARVPRASATTPSASVPVRRLHAQLGRVQVVASRAVAVAIVRRVPVATVPVATVRVATVRVATVRLPVPVAGRPVVTGQLRATCHRGRTPA
jgi:hypothetical protein